LIFIGHRICEPSFFSLKIGSLNINEKNEKYGFLALFRFFVWVRFKKKLYEFIDQADEKMLKLMYAMAQADMEKTDFELSDAHVKILEEKLLYIKPIPNQVLIGRM